ncbi:MAG: hypothetical protein PHX21_04430 [bacterium]|nr:hypothetical protein [bacterium]
MGNKVQVKNIIAVFIIILFSSSILRAEVGETEDIIYLKNGSIIKGMIIEQIFNVSTTIETKDGKVFVFKPEDISKIIRRQLKTDKIVPQTKIGDAMVDVCALARKDAGGKKWGWYWGSFIFPPNIILACCLPPSNPPGEKLIYTSSDYVNTYTKCYRKEIKSSRIKDSLRGGLIGGSIAIITTCIILYNK